MKKSMQGEYIFTVQQELLKEGIYHRLLAAADKPPSLSPMGVSGRNVVDASSSTPSQLNKVPTHVHSNCNI
jgi:hypothetical protein